MPAATIADTKVGMQLLADAGFTCLEAGDVVDVREDDGGLYVPCSTGKHYLDGQIAGNIYVGFSTLPEGGA